MCVVFADFACHSYQHITFWKCFCILSIEHGSSLSECINFDVRLTGGSSNNTGAVEICINQLWSSVCRQGLDKQDVAVVCAALGFQRYGKYSHTKHHAHAMNL